MAGDPDPQGKKAKKPPRRYWKATEPFCDLKFSHLIEIFLTLSLVGVGASQVLVYLRQAGIMDKQAEISDAANKLTSSIQRAFIVVDELRQEPVTDREGKMITWRFTPVIQNSGSTPAKSVTFVTLTPKNDWEFIETDLEYRMSSWRLGAPSDLDENLASAPAGTDLLYIITNTVLGPHGTILPLFGAEEISVQDADQMQYNRHGLGRFFYGNIRYIDMFDVPHITKYCFTTDGWAAIRGEAKPIPRLCRHWNCVDEECKKDKEKYDREAAWLKGHPNALKDPTIRIPSQ
jgi:hypothetical protein